MILYLAAENLASQHSRDHDDVSARGAALEETTGAPERSLSYQCLAKIEALRADGVTILFVSHDENMVRRLCSRGPLRSPLPATCWYRPPG